MKVMFCINVQEAFEVFTSNFCYSENYTFNFYAAHTMYFFTIVLAPVVTDAVVLG